jgi:F0F1-type ATP synthase gamma subunit
MNLRRIRAQITSYESFRDTLQAVQLLSAAEIASLREVFNKRLLCFTPFSGYFSNVLTLGQFIGRLPIILFPLTSDATGCGIHNQVVFDSTSVKGRALTTETSAVLLCLALGQRAKSFFLETFKISLFVWFFMIRIEQFSFFYSFSFYNPFAESKALFIIIFNRFYSIFRLLSSTYILLGVSSIRFMCNRLNEAGFAVRLPLLVSFLCYLLLICIFAFYNCALFLDALIENDYAGVACKISSLSTAASNTDDYINELFMDYNRERQEVITTQLMESVTHIIID